MLIYDLLIDYIRPILSSTFPNYDVWIRHDLKMNAVLVGYNHGGYYHIWSENNGATLKCGRGNDAYAYAIADQQAFASIAEHCVDFLRHDLKFYNIKPRTP
jgi:hypothetical protein